MSNAKKELIKHIEGRNVEFLSLVIRGHSNSEPIRIKGTLEEILPQLDFDYNNGNGRQVIFGYIWYDDGTWSERMEYTGGEWWRHIKCPDRDVNVKM